VRFLGADIVGVSLWGPGLEGWAPSRAVLAGLEPYIARESPVVAPTMLPPNEHRRAGAVVRLALTVAHAAVESSQLAAKDPNRLLECSSMLGICFMDKGMPKLAVKWFEKGLKAPGRSDEEYQGLRYDLAMAHEASGDLDTALNIFEDLYGQDAHFRDVAQKVRDLRAALPS